MSQEISLDESGSAQYPSDPIFVELPGSTTSSEQDQHIKCLPSCQWLDTEVISEGERLRRVLVLRRICDRMLGMKAEERAKSLSAFANQTKALRSITTYTVPPHQLLCYLQDVPEGAAKLLLQQTVPFSSTLFENLEAESAHNAWQRWNRLTRDGIITKSSVGELSRLIQGLSCTKRSYAAESIVAALRELQIIDDDESVRFRHQVPSEWIKKVLPQYEFDVTRPWSQHRSVCHTVRRRSPLPALASGGFFGRKGLKLQEFLEGMRKKCSEVKVISPPEVQLKVNTSTSKDAPLTVDLTLTWDRWEKGRKAKDGAVEIDVLIDALVQELRQHIATLYRKSLELRASRRKRRAEKLQRAGEAYHNFRLTERLRRKLDKNDSARRAFEIAACTSRKMRPGNSFQRKDIPRQRRRAYLREKRRRQFNASEDNRLWGSPLGDRSEKGADKLTGFAQRLQKHLSNVGSDRADEVKQNFASLRRARDQDFRRCKQQTSKKMKDVKLWRDALLDFDVL